MADRLVTGKKPFSEAMRIYRYLDWIEREESGEWDTMSPERLEEFKTMTADLVRDYMTVYGFGIDRGIQMLAGRDY